jgi:hypothetical protein
MSQSQKELARKIVSSIIGKLDEAVKSWTIPEWLKVDWLDLLMAWIKAKFK